MFFVIISINAHTSGCGQKQNQRDLSRPSLLQDMFRRKYVPASSYNTTVAAMHHDWISITKLSPLHKSLLQAQAMHQGTLRNVLVHACVCLSSDATKSSTHQGLGAHMPMRIHQDK